MVQRWLEFLTAFDYTPEYRKGSANGNADSLSRLPEPATDHDRSGSSSLIPVEDCDIFLIRACGLRTLSSPTPGVGFEWAGARSDNAVLRGLPFTSSDVRDFRARGPRMEIDDLSAPLGIFVARLSASVAAVDMFFFFAPTANTAFARLLSYPQGATRALRRPPQQRRQSLCALLSRQALHSEKIPP